MYSNISYYDQIIHCDWRQKLRKGVKERKREATDREKERGKYREEGRNTHLLEIIRKRRANIYAKVHFLSPCRQ